MYRAIPDKPERFFEDVVHPLQKKSETVYVVPNSDAEDDVARRFPNKRAKRVSNGLAGQGSIRAFLRGLDLVFQRGKSDGLSAVYHVTLPGRNSSTPPLRFATKPSRSLSLRPRLDHLKAEVQDARH
jgi:hypothetical protein